MKKEFIILILFLVKMSSCCAQLQPMFVEGFAQGTTYHITYIDKEERFFKKEIDSILKDFDFSVSTYNPNSIITKVNTNKDVVLDNYFLTCFNQGKKVWKDTHGTFDPTVFPLVNAWGFGPGKKQKIESRKIDSILKFVGFNLINLKNNKVVKSDSRVALDFNAFAQGYSVDVIASFLNSKGITSYIVEIGGEVYAQGTSEEGKKWVIGIETPIENKAASNPIIQNIQLDGLAIATSGNYRKYIEEDGTKYAHHIDPRTGYPTKNSLLSVSIVSKKGIISDAYATGVLVMGLEKAIKFLKKHKELEAFLIYADTEGKYQFYETPRFKLLKI
ncbi:FAD:protein FMN transferase [Flavobacterium aciduliphilum]|uniref:FAD:protein FMN transferase n=1 Tax=Flavobacterium aciduliphilum TaxID=1101402 RepID=A0A328YPU4_9FLAO|nr:FAD:protein FMN transferase [Flavobacterium aciduliphilum]RAR75630.1 thiamine biosynthesis lipoprotein [Flavobacterium aciduliphilum]